MDEYRDTEDGQNTSTVPNSSSMATVTGKKRKEMTPRSEFWKGYEKFSKENEIMARCLNCKKELRANNGTAPLKNHLVHCKGKNLLESNQTELVGIGLHGEKSLVSYKYDYDTVRKALAKMIILDELPFKFVSELGFKLLMEVACPRFYIPSRWTIQRDCYQIFISEKDILRDFFKKSSQRICITTDTWTSLQKVNYMCMTAHFIDENWTLHKKLLSFSPIFSHKGKDIGIALETCLRDWGIDKVFTVIVDNATANDKVLDYLRDKLKSKCISDGKYMHLRCVAHILHLIVTDGLALCKDSVTKVRMAVKYIKNSPARYTIFKNAIALEDLQYKGWLSLDVRTRWNLTYKMLNGAQNLQQAFVRYEEMDPLFKLTLRDENDERKCLVPTNEDWAEVKRLVAILKRFYNLTLKVSAYKTVSSHSFLQDVANLHDVFQQWKEGDDFSLQMMAMPMAEKYEKYWGENKMSMLLYIAVVLDPRKKLRFLEFTLSDMYGEEKGQRLSEKVKSTLYELFNEYKCKFGSPLVMPSSHVGVSSKEKIWNADVDANKDDDDFITTQRVKRFKILEQRLGESNKSELDKYLGEDREDYDGDDHHFDILSWWKVLCSRFPILGHIARDVLAIHVSTVASEATFSKGGRVLYAFRSSLSPRIVESLLCTQDWLRGMSPDVSIEEDLDEMEELEDGFLSMGMDVYQKFMDSKSPY